MVIGTPKPEMESANMMINNSPDMKEQKVGAEKEESLFTRFQKWLDSKENNDMLLAAKHKVLREKRKDVKEEILIEELENLYYIFLKKLGSKNIDFTKESDDLKIILSIDKKRTLLSNLESKIMGAKNIYHQEMDEEEKKSSHYSEMFGTLNFTGKRLKDHEVPQTQLSPSKEKRKQSVVTA